MAYEYLGYAKVGFPAYADEDTGQMLVAEPGKSYNIRAVEPGALVPPPGGMWEQPEPPADDAPADKPAGEPPAPQYSEPGTTTGEAA